MNRITKYGLPELCCRFKLESGVDKYHADVEVAAFARTLA
jgi:hypothetical protein